MSYLAHNLTRRPAMQYEAPRSSAMPIGIEG